MRKDIHIPDVEDVYLAVVQEQHLEYKTMDWYAYVINNSDADIEMILIVSKGYSSEKVTPPMRHQLPLLPAHSYAKVEYLQEKVLALNNEFKLTFFKDNQMFDKTYFFEKNAINTKALQNIPLMKLKGILRK